MKLTWTPLSPGASNPSLGYLYADSYAGYLDPSAGKLVDPLNQDSWILRDASGNKLYIPYGNPPVQYAMSIWDPNWISRMLQ